MYFAFKFQVDKAGVALRTGARSPKASSLMSGGERGFEQLE